MKPVFKEHICGMYCSHCGSQITEKVNLPSQKPPTSEAPVDILVSRIAEIDSLIRCTHTDMGGKHKYHISERHFDKIGQIVKELLWDLTK